MMRHLVSEATPELEYLSADAGLRQPQRQRKYSAIWGTG
jgi:hypothetical protein